MLTNPQLSPQLHPLSQGSAGCADVCRFRHPPALRRTPLTRDALTDAAAFAEYLWFPLWLCLWLMCLLSCTTQATHANGISHAENEETVLLFFLAPSTTPIKIKPPGRSLHFAGLHFPPKPLKNTIYYRLLTQKPDFLFRKSFSAQHSTTPPQVGSLARKLAEEEAEAGRKGGAGWPGPPLGWVPLAFENLLLRIAEGCVEKSCQTPINRILVYPGINKHRFSFHLGFCLSIWKVFKLDERAENLGATLFGWQLIRH